MKKQKRKRGLTFEWIMDQFQRVLAGKVGAKQQKQKLGQIYGYLMALRIDPSTDHRTCVYCGCTDSRACSGGCSWVELHKATATGVCSLCADLGIEHHQITLRKRLRPPNRYKANFLWPHKEYSAEEAGYEFANAATEGYQKLVWSILVSRLKYPAPLRRKRVKT